MAPELLDDVFLYWYVKPGLIFIHRLFDLAKSVNSMQTCCGSCHSCGTTTHFYMTMNGLLSLSTDASEI
jgi:hypothetical protein